MRVLIAGGGGREHALAWKLSQSREVEKIYCAPGNAGIAGLAECVSIGAGEKEKLQRFAREKEIHLTVVGPEAPLMDGIVDLFQENGQLIFGPTQSAARLEGSKVWAKELMHRHGLPSPGFQIVDNPRDAYELLEKSSFPLVVKADGLAAGKGVSVAESYEQAAEAVHDMMEDKIFGSAGDRVIIEECIQGEEVSVFALTDGSSYLLLPSAQDHKPVFDGDQGPNTGGMGCYSPAPVFTPALQEQVCGTIIEPLLDALQKEGIVYQGVLYGGLMVTEDGPQILEFNVRFGDPEAQVLLPRLETDLFPLLYESARGNLEAAVLPRWVDDAAVCVVLASGGYPGSYEKGKIIHGLDRVAGEEKAMVFHAGTSFKDHEIVTAGGRVLGVTAWEPKLEQAVQKAYRLAEKISFEGMHYRSDIAYRALGRSM